MKFQFYEFQELPKLAWCAAFQNGSEVVRVLTGPWVENRESFFCEGAWDSDFRNGKFEEGFMAGSGGRITHRGDVLLVSPSHTLERLYSVRVSETLHVSNSLAFLLSMIDDKLDPKYLFYRAIFHSIRNGIKKCLRSIPTLKRRRVRLHYYCNLNVSPELTVTEMPKHMPEDFLSFDQYASFLRDAITRLCRNAVDKERTKAYEPIATISSGYDSAAAAVFARAAGCTEALTFRDQDDSGAEIARVLGMNVREYDRHDYLKTGDFPEAEFWACGIHAMDAVMLALESRIQQRLLFTGAAGDILWDKNWNYVSRDIDRWDPYATAGSSETGLAEFRLRVGFIHLPLPFIGITSQPSIHLISVSKQMEPWSVGGGYDKPIPRRILEEAGVKRELFGQDKKKGAWLPENDAQLTEASRSDFAAFCSDNWSFARRVTAAVTKMLVLCYSHARIMKRRMEHIAERTGLHIKVPSLAPTTVLQWLLLPVGKESLLPQWGVSKISMRYRNRERPLQKKATDGTIR